MPDSLAENLDVWKHVLVGPHDLKNKQLFDHHTYNAVLLGKRVYETGFGSGTLNPAAAIEPGTWKKYLKDTRAKIDHYLKMAPDHRALLLELRGESEGPASQPWETASGAQGLARATVAMPGFGPTLKQSGATKHLDRAPAKPPMSDDPSLL